MKKWRRSLVLAAALVWFAASAAAQTWPSRPIRIVVPFPPGGATDTAARLVQPPLQQALGVPVVVDNRPGASGTIGTATAAKSLPDGYTLLMTLDTHTVNAAVMLNLLYDPVDDFVAITRIGTMPFVMVGNPQLPIRTLTDFVDLAKARPGELNYGSPAAAVQLAMELFKSLAQIDVRHVAYRGGAPTVQSVLANETQVTFLPPVSAMPSIQSGKLRALAVAGADRLSALPDVPTVAEAGFPGFEAGSWAGLLAPAGTPPAIIARLYAEMVSLLEPAAIRQRFADLGMQVKPIPPDEFSRFIAAQVAKWTAVAREHRVVGRD
jgi:tripartite-type tricarboxylate transporter receptor subunit TctC